MPLPAGRKLERVLAHVNAARLQSGGPARAALVAATILLGESPGRASEQQLAERIDRELGRPSQRLAVYGSLRPGGSNQRVLADLGERWSAGWVRGVLYPDGRGRTGGFPGIELAARGEPIEVSLLASAALPGHWDRIDAFEGPAYRRLLTALESEPGGVLVANIYTLAP